LFPVEQNKTNQSIEQITNYTAQCAYHYSKPNPKSSIQQGPTIIGCYRDPDDHPSDHAANAPIQPTVTCPSLSLKLYAIHDVSSKVLDTTPFENLH
jgi:hypothetical protein